MALVVETGEGLSSPRADSYANDVAHFNERHVTLFSIRPAWDRDIPNICAIVE